ncbi:sugar-binding protein [Winogradskyella aurantiaca]|uniref:sugar-binding protein n=1 Tax=Winogradskyella aurantiaca TaxID=2219558 RepID=UPI000E1D7329|nr:sugar-binding protein [Winogradskyella aurantiaca]
MKRYSKLVSTVWLSLLSVLAWSQNNKKKDYDIKEVHKTNEEIIIDGIANESVWEEQEWHPIDQLWLGDAYSPDDFSGRYKLVWDPSGLYLLAEITDDILLDNYEDPLTKWWDEDCLEIFIDENNSGGDHQFNHSAFAYHVDLKGNVVDVTPNQTGKLYNSHVLSERVSTGNITYWEVKILLYDDTYVDDSEQQPQQLSAGKKMGFALAYCDNDSSEHRENFIGSSNHPGFKQDLGWKDASVFGTLILKE